MYMSYCRFEGTKAELNACIDEVAAHVNEEAEYEVSEREIECFRDMVHNFASFLRDSCILDDAGEIDEDMLDDVCYSMGMSYAEEEDWNV